MSLDFRCSFLALLAFWLLSFEVFTSPILTTDDIISRQTNLTAQRSYNPPPSEFTVAFDPSSGREEMGEERAFRLAFNMLTVISGSPFDSPFPKDRQVVWEGSNRLQLIVTGARPQDSWLTKHAVWGIVLTLQQMAHGQTYRDGVVYLRSQDQAVGMLNFTRTPRNLILPSQTATQSALSLLGSSSEVYAPGTWYCRPYYFGNLIPSLDARMAVLAGYSLVVPLDSSGTTDVQDFKASFPGYPRVEVKYMPPFLIPVRFAVATLSGLGEIVVHGTEAGIKCTNRTTGETIGNAQLRLVRELDVGGYTLGNGEIATS